MKQQLEEIRNIGTEIYTNIEDKIRDDYPLTCTISLQGLVNKLLAEYSYSTALLILRDDYGIIRVSETKLLNCNLESPYVNKTAVIPNKQKSLVL